MNHVDDPREAQMNLTSDQVQALDRGDAVPIVVAGRECVVVRKEIYDRVMLALDEWSDEDMRAIMARTMQDDWSDPRMDVYDEP